MYVHNYDVQKEPIRSYLRQVVHIHTVLLYLSLIADVILLVISSVMLAMFSYVVIVRV